MSENSDINSTIQCEPALFEAQAEELQTQGASFITLSTVRDEDNFFRLIYYFRLQDRIIVLKTKTKNNAISSLYSYFSTADFIEREINSLFGIKFIGNPNLIRKPENNSA